MTILLGRPLVRLDNLQLQKEADLRYHLIQTRETAEAIATMGAVEHGPRVHPRPPRRRRVQQQADHRGHPEPRLLHQRVQLPDPAHPALDRGADVHAGPGRVRRRHAVGDGVLGVPERLLADRDPVRDALLVRRGDVRGSTRSPRRSSRRGRRRPRRSRSSYDDARVAYEGLSLWTRHEHRPLIDDLSLEVVHGSNLLITGPDTAAETALFLATAGFWEDGKGRIVRPGPEGIYFVPKQPLTVRCTLRSQLVASSPERPFSDAEILAALEKVGLGADGAARRRARRRRAQSQRPLAGRAAPAHLRPGPAGGPPLRLPRPPGRRAEPRTDRRTSTGCSRNPRSAT